MKKGANFYGLSLLVAAGLLAAVACSRPRNDAQIASEVQARIYADPAVHTRQVTIHSSNGMVTLYGSASSDAERFAAAGEAARVDGVKTVVNNLQVAPPARTQVAQPPQPAAADQSAAPPSAPAHQAGAQRVPGSAQSSAVAPTDASGAKQPENRRKAESAPRSVLARHKEVQKAAGTLAAKNDGADLPYSTGAPASSPVGASQPAAAAATAANEMAPRPTSPTNSISTTANSAATPAATTPAVTPSASATAPVVPPAPPKPVTISAGTTLSVRLLDRIDSATSHPGDTFRATLDTPLADDSGATVIPAGYEVTGKVVDAKSAGRFAGNSALALELTQLSVNGKQYSLQTNQYARRGKSRGKSTAEKVGGGAALGAILGGIFGGAKGAAIGATVGAGAGTGVSATGKGEQVVLRTETVLNFQLQSPLSVVPTTRSPHGSQESNSTGNAAPSSSDHSSAQADGPPVLKRRSQ